MNWDAIGAVGELLGSLAASLLSIYFGVESGTVMMARVLDGTAAPRS